MRALVVVVTFVALASLLPAADATTPVTYCSYTNVDHRPLVRPWACVTAGCDPARLVADPANACMASHKIGGSVLCPVLNICIL